MGRRLLYDVYCAPKKKSGRRDKKSAGNGHVQEGNTVGLQSRMEGDCIGRESINCQEHEGQCWRRKAESGNGIKG